MFELLSRALKYVFIFLIYYFLLNFLKIMVADLRNEKSQPKETGFVITDEDGNLKFLDIKEDEKLNNHINELSKDEEIINVISKVNSELINALEKDKTLKTLVDNIS